MSHRAFLLLAVLLLSAAGASGVRAQNNPASPAGAQSSETPGQPAGSEAQTSPAQSSAKKVWTNDDVGDLRESSTISTFTAPKAKPSNGGEKPGIPKGSKDAKWYHDQIAKLQAQIPELDRQIAELQAAINGKPTGDGKESARPRGVKADDWSVEMGQLQTKRDGIQDRIAALQDQARRNGVPASALP